MIVIQHRLGARLDLSAR